MLFLCAVHAPSRCFAVYLHIYLSVYLYIYIYIAVQVVIDNARHILNQMIMIIIYNNQRCLVGFRFLVGLQANQSNAALLVPHIRSGILVHTGEWSGWAPPMEMPNSAGCLHSWPQFIHQIAELLPTLGVKMRNNTGGAMPYPYETQGLLSVELVG